MGVNQVIYEDYVSSFMSCEKARELRNLYVWMDFLILGKY